MPCPELSATRSLRCTRRTYWGSCTRRFVLRLSSISTSPTPLLQFHERYKNFKVPVSALKRGVLLRQVRQAGTKLDEAVEELLAEEEKASKPKRSKLGRPRKKSEAPSDTETEEEAPSPQKSLGAVIDLGDLLPPLPQKGAFDVETIKGSLYFFS